jgi:hypothetical protein
MYTLISRWILDSRFNPESINDRVNHIVDFDRRERFQKCLDDGLVDNVGGPNCYVNVTDEYIEACNATWKTLEVAQTWLNEFRDIPLVLEAKLLDESGTVLDSFSRQV